VTQVGAALAVGVRSRLVGVARVVPRLTQPRFGAPSAARGGDRRQPPALRQPHPAQRCSARSGSPVLSIRMCEDCSGTGQGAEAFGTFWLTFGGCGSAVLAAAFGGTDSNLGIGLLGVALAFGLTVLTMAFAIGHISGCHLNPAVTLGLVSGGRHPAKEALPYILSQVVGAVLAAGVLYVIATGKADAEIGGFASNGYGEHSPGGYGLVAALVTEVVLTMFFLIVIMGATDSRAPAGLVTTSPSH